MSSTSIFKHFTIDQALTYCIVSNYIHVIVEVLCVIFICRFQIIIWLGVEFVLTISQLILRNNNGNSTSHLSLAVRPRNIARVRTAAWRGVLRPSRLGHDSTWPTVTDDRFDGGCCCAVDRPRVQVSEILKFVQFGGHKKKCTESCCMKAACFCDMYSLPISFDSNMAVIHDCTDYI